LARCRRRSGTDSRRGRGLALFYRAPEAEDARVRQVAPGVPHRPGLAVVANRHHGAQRGQAQLGEALLLLAAVPAAPALAVGAGLYPLLEQLLADVAFMGVDGVVGQVQRTGVRVGLAVEVLGPGDVLLVFLYAYVGIDVARTVAPASPTTATTAAIMATAAAPLAATA